MFLSSLLQLSLTSSHKVVFEFGYVVIKFVFKNNNLFYSKLLKIMEGKDIFEMLSASMHEVKDGGIVKKEVCREK